MPDPVPGVARRCLGPARQRSATCARQEWGRLVNSWIGRNVRQNTELTDRQSQKYKERELYAHRERGTQRVYYKEN
jgi:hypothetical protein